MSSKLKFDLNIDFKLSFRQICIVSLYLHINEALN